MMLEGEFTVSSGEVEVQQKLNFVKFFSTSMFLGDEEGWGEGE